MSAPSPTTVLISELAALSSQRSYLPYVWGLLRWEVEHRHPTLWDQVRWLPPMFGPRSPTAALRELGTERIDVLGLSCYTWNWDPQRELARLVREANPDCLIVAGGPQPDTANPDFFERHPYIDAVVVNDGEIPFARIVERAASGARDLSRIPGVVVRGADGRPRMALAPEKPTDFSHSPYVEYAAVYEEILRAHPGMSVVLETNRGCPYKCSFCDWGSNTMSKIRAFDMDRVRAEATWAFRQPLLMVFLADANFGILPRDVEIAELLTELRRAEGGPKFFYYSPAKNNPERSVAIASMFARAGLAGRYHVAVQHTDPEVLAATDRANISIDKQRRVIRELTRDGVPLAAQLILGIPGDTPHKWAQVFADLMEWGVHDAWSVSEYALLPNAPAATPQFRERWQYETIRRPAAAHGRSRPRGSHRGVCALDLIVACRSFSREDWVEMRTRTAILTGLHNSGFTRRIAQFLRFRHDVGYRQFYDEVIGQFVRRIYRHGAWWTRIADGLRTYLADADATDALDLPEIPDLDLDLRYDDWVMLHVGLERDEFFSGLVTFLEACHPDARWLRDVVEFQRQLVITPEYDPDRGRVFTTERDWTAYFTHIDGCVQYEPLGDPEPLPPRSRFEIHDAASGLNKQVPLNWASHPKARPLAWARCVVSMDRSAQSQCFDLPELRPLPEPIHPHGPRGLLIVE